MKSFLASRPAPTCTLGPGEHWVLPPTPTPLTQEQSPGSQVSLATMPEAPEVLEETVTVEEDPGTPTSHVSIVMSEDGTTRRTETKVGLGPRGWQVGCVAAVAPCVEWAPVPAS